MEKIVEIVETQFASICKQFHRKEAGEFSVSRLNEKDVDGYTILYGLYSRCVTKRLAELREYIESYFDVVPKGLQIKLTLLLTSLSTNNLDSVISCPFHSREVASFAPANTLVSQLWEKWRTGVISNVAYFNYLNKLVASGYLDANIFIQATNSALQVAGYKLSEEKTPNALMNPLATQSNQYLETSFCTLNGIEHSFATPNEMELFSLDGKYAKLSRMNEGDPGHVFCSDTTKPSVSNPYFRWEHAGESKELNLIGSLRSGYHPTIIIGDCIEVETGLIEVDHVIAVDSILQTAIIPHSSGPHQTCSTTQNNDLIEFALLVEGRWIGYQASSSGEEVLSIVDGKSELAEDMYASHLRQTGNSSPNGNGGDANPFYVPDYSFVNQYYVLFVSCIQEKLLIRNVTCLSSTIQPDQIPIKISYPTFGLCFVHGTNSLLAMITMMPHCPSSLPSPWPVQDIASSEKILLSCSSKSTHSATTNGPGRFDSSSAISLLIPDIIPLQDILNPDLKDRYHALDAVIIHVDYHLWTKRLVSLDNTGKICIYAINDKADNNDGTKGWELLTGKPWTVLEKKEEERMVSKADPNNIVPVGLKVMHVQWTPSGEQLIIACLDRLLLYEFHLPEPPADLASNLFTERCVLDIIQHNTCRYQVVFEEDTMRIWRIMNALQPEELLEEDHHPCGEQHHQPVSVEQFAVLLQQYQVHLSSEEDSNTTIPTLLNKPLFHDELVICTWQHLNLDKFIHRYPSSMFQATSSAASSSPDMMLPYPHDFQAGYLVPEATEQELSCTCCNDQQMSAFGSPSGSIQTSPQQLTKTSICHAMSSDVSNVDESPMPWDTTTTTNSNPMNPTLSQASIVRWSVDSRRSSVSQQQPRPALQENESQHEELKEGPMNITTNNNNRTVSFLHYHNQYIPIHTPTNLLYHDEPHPTTTNDITSYNNHNTNPLPLDTTRYYRTFAQSMTNNTSQRTIGLDSVSSDHHFPNPHTNPITHSHSISPANKATTTSSTHFLLLPVIEHSIYGLIRPYRQSLINLIPWLLCHTFLTTHYPTDATQSFQVHKKFFAVYLACYTTPCIGLVAAALEMTIPQVETLLTCTELKHFFILQSTEESGKSSQTGVGTITTVAAGNDRQGAEDPVAQALAALAHGTNNATASTTTTTTSLTSTMASDQGQKTIIRYKASFIHLVCQWMVSKDVRRLGQSYSLDLAMGHNLLCALYLKYCGNKSVAVEHVWQGYLTTYGNMHLRHASRGLRQYTQQIRKIDETANIKHSLPHQIGYIAGLQEIYARRVGLSGPIPLTIGQLCHLRVLSLGNNHLTGPLPSCLAELTSLQRIVLHQNNLIGQVPEQLGQLGCIVNLAGNPRLLHGEDVPTNERQALIQIYLATNGQQWETNTHWMTSEPVCKWYKVGVLASHVHSLVMSSNDMQGYLPTTITALQHLRMIELATMPGLRGPIPKELCTILTLRRLCICRCGLTGKIPDEIGQLIHLEELQLFGNKLSGHVPDSLRHLTKLKLLSLGEYTGGNDFVPDLFPSAIRSLISLEALFLANCHLTGPLPGWLGELSELRQLDLQRNGLQGNLPTGLGRLNNLLYFNIKDNVQLCGRLPVEEFAGLVKLNRLSLLHCNFQDRELAEIQLKQALPRCKIWL